MKLFEEFKLYENMWKSTQEKLYAEVQATVDSCLQHLKLDKYCEDSYDNSYDDGDAMQYELLWNFNKVPNQTKLQSALDAALLNICTAYGVDISVTVDDDMLADEGYINLLVAYEIPYNITETVETSNKLSESTSTPIIKTFGRKTYDLSNKDDLWQWYDANVRFQVRRHPNSYRGDGSKLADASLKLNIARNLIASLKKDGVNDPELFSTLERFALHQQGRKDSAANRPHNLQYARQEITELVNNFLASLASDSEREAVRARMQGIADLLVDFRINGPQVFYK